MRPRIFLRSATTGKMTSHCRHSPRVKGKLGTTMIFWEISYLNQPLAAEALIAGHSYSDQYLEAVLSKASSIGIKEANVFVMASKRLFDSPRSVDGGSFKL